MAMKSEFENTERCAILTKNRSAISSDVIALDNNKSCFIMHINTVTTVLKDILDPTITTEL